MFQLEIETLIKIRETLDGSYTDAVELLFACTGKVVVSGAGKSGLIAQKIAATMVSTGTPAVSLHPGDAMHGDVGVIRNDDVVLAISKSGETEELLNLLPYLKQAKVPVISIQVQFHSSNRNAAQEEFQDLVAIHLQRIQQNSHPFLKTAFLILQP